jgi:hypothetical protein
LRFSLGASLRPRSSIYTAPMHWDYSTHYHTWFICLANFLPRLVSNHNHPCLLLRLESSWNIWVSAIMSCLTTMHQPFLL